MPKIVTVEEMIRIEKAADAAGHTYDMMMDFAGKSVAEAILERFPDIESSHVLVLVGTGNNGGDGLVAAKHLAERGATVAIYLTKGRSEEDPHLAAVRGLGILVAEAGQDQRYRVLNLQLDRADIVIDAVLGTGFKLPLRGTAKAILRAAKRAESTAYIVAVDCPSGLECDTGEIASEGLVADLTITLAAAKPGLFQFPGAEHVGELVIGDIGLPKGHAELGAIRREVATDQLAVGMLPERPLGAHKGTFGRAMVVAGSVNYPGAAALSGRAAYLAGAGLVTMAVPSVVQELIAGSIPECTWLPVAADFDRSSSDQIRRELARTDAVLVGPGFGMAPETLEFLDAFLSDLENSIPVVIDADALKLLTRLDSWQERLPANSILTPHPGEMAVLTGKETHAIQADRTAVAVEKSVDWGQIVVLKGAYTVIANQDGRSVLIPVATPALARAGTGDVLSGLIVGFLAQGMPVFEAAVLGSFVHARAGIIGAELIGTVASVVAGDVADAVPLAIAELEALAL